jgi:hypothetical protein
MGMCIVDMHRLYRSEKRLRNRALCDQVLEEDTIVIRAYELTCGKLVKGNPRTESPTTHGQLTRDDGILDRIKIDGETTRPVTEENAKLGETVGKPIQQTSFLCHWYSRVCYINEHFN